MVEYAKHLAEWAESVGVKEVVILSGLNSGKRDRKEMMEGYAKLTLLQNCRYIFISSSVSFDFVTSHAF